MDFLGALQQKKTALNVQQIKKSIEFCRSHCEWKLEEWHKVIFSVKTKIELHPCRREYARRPKKSIYNPKYTTKRSNLVVNQLLYGVQSRLMDQGYL